MYLENNVLTKHKTEPGLAGSLYAHLILKTTNNTCLYDRESLFQCLGAPARLTKSEAEGDLVFATGK